MLVIQKILSVRPQLKPMPEAMVLQDKQTYKFLFIRCIDKFSVLLFKLLSLLFYPALQIF